MPARARAVETRREVPPEVSGSHSSPRSGAKGRTKRDGEPKEMKPREEAEEDVAKRSALSGFAQGRMRLDLLLAQAVDEGLVMVAFVGADRLRIKAAVF